MAHKARWTKAINFMIAQDAYDKAKHITDADETSLAKWFRSAIDEKLKREWPQYERGEFNNTEI